MFDLDNSETSWLVYADWLEDQDIDASHIREGVANPLTIQHLDDNRKDAVGGMYGVVGIENPVGGGGVGGVGCGRHIVGDGESTSVVAQFTRLSIPLVRRIYPALSCLI